MSFKSVEISYDTSTIPGISPDDWEGALAFRSEAMELIEEALKNASAGQLSDDCAMTPEDRKRALQFGFDVTEFGRAETVIRGAVKCTIYDNIRKIKRIELH